MDTVIGALVIYLFLLLMMRVAGRRTLGQMTAFDLILLLVIGEATQQAILGDDYSLTTALIAIAALVGADVAFSLLKAHFPRLEKVIEGEPMLLVEDGRPLLERMRRSRVGEDEVLQAARRLRGLESLSEIKYAVLEADGHITVIPKRPKTPAAAPDAD